MRIAFAAMMLGCLIPAGFPAHAASFDCTASANRVERMICVDAALSAADGALGAVFTAALAASPHPQALRADQRKWIASDRNKAATPNELLAAYQHRTDDLRKQTAGWQAIRHSVRASGPDRCVQLIDQDDAVCTVTEAGVLAGWPGGVLRYRLQTWRTGEQTIGTAIVVLAGDGADAQAVTWAADEDTYYEAPKILTTAQGALLDLPGHVSGTGNLSAESLFVLRDGAWREVDITSWIDQMAARPPKDVGAWKGIYPNWRAMTARTPLWREGDGNCCPHAGSATATLRLDRDRIVLLSLRVSSEPLPDQ